MRTSLEQTERKIEFIEANIELCDRVLLFVHAADALTTEEGIELLNKARKDLEYSPKTDSGDIMRFLRKIYFKIKRLSIKQINTG